MSNHWLTWVFEAAEVTGTQRLVLLALANRADDDGVCWPSLDTIAAAARVSRRRAEDAVRALAAAGFIEREVNAAPVARHGGYRSNLYRLRRVESSVVSTSAHDETGPPDTSGPDVERPPHMSGPDVSGPPDTSGLGVDDSGEQPPPNRPPKTSLETSVEPSCASSEAQPLLRLVDNPERSEAEIAADRFEEYFWPTWPRRHGRRVGKAQALKRWVKLSLDDQRAALRGAKAYAAHCQRTDTFPKDAERWLRDRLWEEWLAPDDGPGPPAAATGIGAAAYLPNGGRLTVDINDPEMRAAMGFPVGATP